MRDTGLAVRVAADIDAACLLAIYAPYVEQTAITFEYEVPSLEEFRARMEAVLAFYPYLVAERDGAIVGYTYASPFKGRPAYDWAVETSIYVAWDERGSGAGRVLHDALELCLAAQGILNMEACIAYPRVTDEFLTRNSAEFHAHLGYRMVGEFEKCGYKSGRWYNMVWMEKLIGAHRDDQPAPLPFSSVRHQLEASGVLKR